MKKIPLTKEQEKANDFMIFNELIARLNKSSDYFIKASDKDPNFLKAIEVQKRIISLCNSCIEDIETKYNIELTECEKINGININYRISGSIKIFIDPEKPKQENKNQIKMEGLR